MSPKDLIPLPEPSHDGAVSLERAIKGRRSTRDFSNKPVPVEELGQLLWAGQGLTRAGSRAAPSAGALFPLELYALVGLAGGFDPGVYHYLPPKHNLLLIRPGDHRRSLWEVALKQDAVRTAPIIIVIAAVVERTAAKYGRRAERYVDIEVGAAAQNISLQAESLGLGSVLIGAFQDRAAKQVLNLPRDHRVIGLIPIGHPLTQSGGIDSRRDP